MADLPVAAPNPRPAARGLQAVSSWRQSNTPTRRGGTEMPSGHRRLVRGLQVVYPWRLRRTPQRRYLALAPGQVPTRRRSKRSKRTPADDAPCQTPPAAAAAPCRELNRDALFDLLLILPAKDLCRLRAVCKPWRSLTTDPLFIAKHMSAHPGLLFLAKFRNDLTHIHVVDLSGTVIKTMEDASANHMVQFSRLSLACLATDWNRCGVLNPATGAVHVLPQDPAPEHVNRVNLSNPFTFFALGRVSSTGEHKVLKYFNRPGFLDLGEQLFEVYTINGGAAHARWRARDSPGRFVDHRKSAVVDGVVYFLPLNVTGTTDPDCVMSFDLGTEEWRANVPGPISGDAEAIKRYRARWDTLALAELNGSFVLVYYHQYPYAMDMWFLTQNGTWDKKYSIHMVRNPTYGYQVRPLLMLPDGRIILYLIPLGQLHIYNPQTNTTEEVHMRSALDSVGMFTGSLLSLQQGDML